MKVPNAKSNYSGIMGGVAFGIAIGAAGILLVIAALTPGKTGNFLYDYQTLFVGLAALAVTIVSVIAALQSHRTAQLQLQVAQIQAQAAIFSERMAIFQSVKDFLRPWFRDGVPDLGELYKLVDAWERSKFLFDQSVTDFLRQLWKDAVDAQFQHRIIAGEIAGNHNRAVEKNYAYAVKYLGGEADRPDILVEAFKSMKIENLQ